MRGLGMSADLVHENALSVGFREVAQQITSLFGQAIAGARLEVDDIIESGERDTQRIEHLLDHMLGFCCDPEMLVELKRLCRYYYIFNSQAAVDYVHAYRDMWNMQDDEGAGV